MRTPPRPLDVPKKKNYVVNGVEVEQETSAPPPKRNPGFAPVKDPEIPRSPRYSCSLKLVFVCIIDECMVMLLC